MPNYERFDFDTGTWSANDPTQRSRNEPSKMEELAAPADPPREGSWHGKGKDLRSTAFYSLAVGATLVPLVFAVVFRSIIGVLLAGIPLLFGRPKIIAAFSKRDRQATKEDLRMLEGIGEETQCLVEATIFREGKAIGTDRGVAWLFGHKLMFSGRATSFAIAGEDVLPRRQWKENYSDVTLDGLYVPLRTGRRTDSIRLIPLGREQGMANEIGVFERRLSLFRDQPHRSDGLLRQWPPFDENPRGERRTPAHYLRLSEWARSQKVWSGFSIALLLGAIMALAADEELRTEAFMRERGARATAVVDKAWSGKSPGGIYSFEAEGRKWTGEANLNLAVGDRISITYLRENPALSKADGTYQGATLRSVALILGAVGLIGLAAEHLEFRR